MSGVVRKQGVPQQSGHESFSTRTAEPKQVKVSAQIIDRCSSSEDAAERFSSYISDDVEVPPMKVVIVNLPDVSARNVELFCSDALGMLNMYRRGADVVIDNSSERTRTVHLKWEQPIAC